MSLKPDLRHHTMHMVSIILFNYNYGRNLRQCLESVFAHPSFYNSWSYFHRASPGAASRSTMQGFRSHIPMGSGRSLPRTISPRLPSIPWPQS